MIVRLGRRAVHNVRRLVKRSPIYVWHRSSAINLYHCSVPKTGSQWIRGILRDPRVYRYSGLSYYNYYARFTNRARGILDLTEVRVTDGLPERTVLSPLYLGFRGFESIPKPAEYRAFFVLRDPRDIAVSWYYSMKYSHRLMGDAVSRWREKLQELPLKEGLVYSIRAISWELGLFEAMRSWAGAPQRDPRVLVVRFEDLVSEKGVETWERLFEHCDIRIPRRTVRALLADHSFERLSGRERGAEDRSSHLRKGEPGDWRNHFDDEIERAFRAEARDLTECLGY